MSSITEELNKVSQRLKVSEQTSSHENIQVISLLLRSIESMVEPIRNQNIKTIRYLSAIEPKLDNIKSLMKKVDPEIIGYKEYGKIEDSITYIKTYIDSSLEKAVDIKDALRLTEEEEIKPALKTIVKVLR